MLIGIHVLGGTEMRSALRISNAAQLVANAFGLKIDNVLISEPPKQTGLPDTILHVTLRPSELHDKHRDHFVQLQQIEWHREPEYRFELARTEAARRRCPVHRRTVDHLDSMARVAQEFAADKDALVNMFLVTDHSNRNAFVAADIQRADADLTAFFRSLK